MKWFLLILVSLVERSTADVGPILGYEQVDVNSLHPLTLNWNQVHYLVRENLLEIDNLRYIQDEFYKELHDCFGLEKCLRESNMMDGPPQSGGQLGAGALLASLREERMTLRARHSQLESRFNEIRRMAGSLAGRAAIGAAAANRTAGIRSSSSWSSSSSGQRGSSGGSSYSSQSSYSYSSSSSSSSRSYGGRYPQGNDVVNEDYHYDDLDGPLLTRG